MALPICFEAFIRSILVLVKVAIENWFYTLGLFVLVVLFFKRQFKYIVIGIAVFFGLAFLLSLFNVQFICEFANWLARLLQ